MRSFWAAGLAVAGALMLTPAARADRILLRGGGEVRGLIVPDPSQPRFAMVQTESGSKPIPFLKTQIVNVVRESGPLDDYFARRDKVKPTAEAQFEFGQWCEQNRLTGLAEVHYQRAVDLDKTFGPAQKKLGRVLHEGKWVTYDELRAAQGMVKHKGRWVSPQELSQLESKATETADKASWARRLRIVHRQLTSGTSEEREAAEKTLAEITDRSAIPGLIKVFANESPALRARLAHALGAIDGPAARTALIDRVVADPDPDVRKVFLDELTARKDSETVPRFVRLLRAREPQTIGRAAWALAMMDTKSAIPKLIPALVQIEQRTEVVDPGAGGGSPGLSVGFGQVRGAPAPSGGFGTSQALPIVTGPVVGPGVVAFGATSVPMISGPAIGGSGVGLSTGGGQAQPTVRVFNILHPNADVLSALVSLTGQDFGYDTDAWRHWLRTASHTEDRPARRARQP